MVLLKGHGSDGFVFYTNEGSTKGKQLAQNPRAALLFHWKSLRRQVRIEGEVERVPDAEADAYFASRARDSQLGAWASDQSRPLDSRETFERRFEEMNERVPGAARFRDPPHLGRAIGWSPNGSNSGAIGLTGCTNGGCSFATDDRLERKGCSTHDDRQDRRRA